MSWSPPRPVLAVLQRRRLVDPTKTKTIRRDYESDVNRRFRILKGVIRDLIGEKDAFGLAGAPKGLEAGDRTAETLRKMGIAVRRRRSPVFDRLPDEIRRRIPLQRFDFPSDPEKMDAFLDWLQEAVDTSILEVRRGPGGRITQRADWQEKYSRAAYARGLDLADARLREAGFDSPEVREELARVFNRPQHVEALGRIYSRNFRELEGVTRAMAQDLSRTLGEGFGRGWGPRRMATALNARVDAIGITRARTIARTETIRAHAEATLNRFEEEGVKEVVGEAELLTAGDHRVCEICAALEGDRISIEEARGVIPVHPNCRCTWVPVMKELGAPAAVQDTPFDEAQSMFDADNAAQQINAELGIIGTSKARDHAARAAGRAIRDHEGLPDAMSRLSVIRSAYASRLRSETGVGFPEGGGTAFREYWDKHIKNNTKARQVAAEAYADDLNNRWASTSADGDPVSLALQRAARDEFGLDKATTGHFSDVPAAVETYNRHGPVMRAALRGQYEETQRFLASKGLDEVTLVRGMRTADIPGTLDLADVTLQPLSSFSTSPGIASSFGNVLFVQKVPADRVLSTPISGFGTYFEKELVVMGGEYRAVVVNKGSFFQWRRDMGREPTLKEIQEFVNEHGSELNR